MVIKCFAAVAVFAALVGCSDNNVALRGAGHPDVELAIVRASQDQPTKAEMLHVLQNVGVVKTPGDVTKVAMILDMSCPLMGFPGATAFSPERMQENLAENWQLDVTVEQASQVQDAQRVFCY